MKKEGSGSGYRANRKVKTPFPILMVDDEESIPVVKDIAGPQEQTVSQQVEGTRTDAGVQEAFDTLPFYVFLVDAKHHILLANKALSQSLGLDLKQIIGAYCPLLMHELDQPLPGCPLEAVLEKNQAVEREWFDSRHGRFLRSVVYPTGRITAEGEPIFLHTIFDISGLQGTFMDTILAIVRICEGIDPYIATHQRRVAQLAHAIAEEMNLSDEHIKWIDVAALVHDISKISAAQGILSNPGRLKSDEFTLIKFHPQMAYDVLKEIDFPGPVAEIVLQHHERINGSGYPKGLPGEAIMLEARILAVADVVEAMSSNRSYRSSVGVERALDEISRNKGISFDPEVVDVCLRLFIEKGFKFN
jgi:PAS domain S-box-containing protein